MQLSEQLNYAKIKMARYRILKILDAGRPVPVGEGLIAEILVDVDLQMTQWETRRALQYLCDKKYVALDIHHGEPWLARLLPEGVDYLEDPRRSDPGIARPESL